jgi:hypothetical protein
MDGRRVDKVLVIGKGEDSGDAPGFYAKMS